MKYIMVENLEGAKNQFLIHTPEGTYFQSYDSLIAFKGFENMNAEEYIYLDINKWNFYKATKKYRNIFLGVKRTADIERKIKGGKYILIDLNHPTAKHPPAGRTGKGGESFEKVIEEIKKSNKWKMKFLGLKFK